MEFILNGEKVTYKGDENLSLLNYLRDEKDITSPKDGCSGQGACGACTVQMDNRAVLSCVTPMKRVKGKKVVTVDGIEEKLKEVFAHAFVEKGGTQCGFCTPGIVMSAAVLLQQNLNPTRKDILKALQKHLCRCTGYTKIIDSIFYAAAILRGEEKIARKDTSGNVGTSLNKFDMHDTVLGTREFVCDMKAEGMLHGALKFSDHPRAKVISIDTTAAKKMKGVEGVFTAEDIPGQRIVGIIKKDWPMMVAIGEETRYIGDVLAGVVAETEEIARAAVKKIKIKYEVQEPVVTVDQAKKKNAHLIHQDTPGNVLSQTKIFLGDPEKAFKEAAHISKGTYYSQRVEHAFIETECCLAVPTAPWGLSDVPGLEVFSQGQGAYEDRKQIAAITDLPLDRINVIQVPNGGGFGGKEDLSVQGHASLFAFLLNKPVRVMLTRDESMNMHPKRHPMRMHYTLACDEQGRLTALKAEIDGDTGAYASVGMKVLERAAGHAASAYEVKNIDIVATSYYTNNVPCGAMRGFGVNQTAFAMEGCIDDLCKKGNFDRWEFRYNNAVDEGSTIATGQKLAGGIGLRDTLMAVKDDFYNGKHVGIACGIKNTGIGNGMRDEGNAKIVIEDRDHIVIHHGWTEMGQGVHTMAIQTVCQETGLNPDIMEVRVETKEDTECGMTTSSRGTSMVGNSLIAACRGLKQDLVSSKIEDLIGKVYKGNWVCDWTTDPEKNDPNVEQVTHYAYGYATQLVILDENGRLERVVAAHDAGKVMNPTLFEGQVEGGVHMGLGYALTEKFEMKNGFPVTTKMSKLGVLRAKDTPEIKVIGVEASDPVGPYGAKGVGEIGLVPTAGAMANALCEYDGVRRYSLPIGYSKKKKR